jgi:hypothetical protein
VRRFAIAFAWLAFAALPARAAVPSSDKIARAVAETNAVSGRSAPMIFDVKLRVDNAAPSAEGQLAVHPSGLARLELKNWSGFVERHLLQSNDYQASRNGEMLADPHPFLPPVFLLQASSGEALEAALTTYGVDGATVVLGKMGPRDCYVFGGRAIGPVPESEHLLPSLWVDASSFDPLRIVRKDGVEYRFGPVQVFGKIRAPSWIDVITPDGLHARLEITRAARAEAPAALFQPSWLTSVPGSRDPR